MSLLEIRCANCGALIENVAEHGQYRCSYCGALIINIVDANIKDGVEIVTPEEMEDYIAKNRKSFVINLGDRIEEFDVEARIINKKIADSESCLEKRAFNHCILAGVPDSPVVLRLKLLHQYKVRNEYELSMQSQRIRENENYKKLMKLCDDTTKETYKIIEEEIEKNIAANEEIKKTDSLIDAGLFEDALIYAAEMLKKHPCRTLAHVRYFYARYRYLATKYMAEVKFWNKLIEYKHRDEFKALYTVMKKCPDFEIVTRPHEKKYEYDYTAYGDRYRGDPSADYPLQFMYLTLLMMEKYPAPIPEVLKYLKDEAKRKKKEAKIAAKEAKRVAKSAKKKGE